MIICVHLLEFMALWIVVKNDAPDPPRPQTLIFHAFLYDPVGIWCYVEWFWDSNDGQAIFVKCLVGCAPFLIGLVIFDFQQLMLLSQLIFTTINNLDYDVLCNLLILNYDWLQFIITY